METHLAKATQPARVTLYPSLWITSAVTQTPPSPVLVPNAKPLPPDHCQDQLRSEKRKQG